MWRDFELTPSDKIRKAAKKALPDVLEATRLTKTELSRSLFGCPSALQRFLSGNAFSYERLEKLVAGFDEALPPVPSTAETISEVDNK